MSKRRKIQSPTNIRQPKETKPKVSKGKKRLSSYSIWNILAIIVLIAVLLIALKLKSGKPITVAPPKEYNDAVTTLKKEIKGELSPLWFNQLSTIDLIPQNRIYINIDSLQIFFENGRNTEIIRYKPERGDYNVIKVDPGEKEQLLGIMADKKLFGLPDSISDVQELANRIGALPEYIQAVKSQVKTRALKREDVFLSLVYNTLTGDAKGHAAVCVRNNKMDIVRSDSFKHGAVIVPRFCSLASDIQGKRINVSDSSFLRILVREKAIDTTWHPHIAYYDLRHDCIRIDDKALVSYKEDSARFNQLAREIKSQPKTIFIYNDDGKLEPLTDSALSNTKILYGTFDKEAIKNVTFRHKREGSAWLFWLIFGFAAGVYVTQAVFTKVFKYRQKKRGITTHQPKNDDFETRYDTTAETIRTALLTSDQATRDGFEEIFENSKKVEKERIIIQQKEEKIEEQEQIIIKQDQTIKKLNGQIKLKEEEIARLKPKADTLDELASTRKESDLIAKLDTLRASNSKMAKITTLASLQEEKGGEKKDDVNTLTEIIEKFDSAADRNLSAVVKRLIDKMKWYDSNFESIVKPTDTFKREASAWRNDTTVLTRHALCDVIAPLMGGNWEDDMNRTTNSLEKQNRESKAFNIVQNTKATKPEPSALLNELKSANISAEEAQWIATLYEAARLYSRTRKFNNAMWNNFIKEFTEKEPLLSDPNSTEDKAWLFAMLFNIAYHTVDQVRGQLNPDDEIIGCFNKRFLESDFDPKTKGIKDQYEKGNAFCSTKHSDTIRTWAEELNIEHLKILIDKYIIMP